jgi:ribosome-associated protein
MTFPTGTTLTAPIISILQDKQAEDISYIDLTGDSAIADYLVMATGNSDVHMRSLANHVEETLEKMSISFRVEGENSTKWILLDAGNVIINIFSREGRSFYRLESIWGTTRTTRIE